MARRKTSSSRTVHVVVHVKGAGGRSRKRATTRRKTGRKARR